MVQAMLQRHLHAVQWNLKNPLLSSYLEECAHRLLYIKGSFWKYTLVLTYSFYWIFFSSVAMESLLIVHCRVRVIRVAAPHRSAISKSYCAELAPVNGREKWDEERFISLQFYFLYFLAEAVPEWQNFDWKKVQYQRTKVYKSNPMLFMLSSSSV